MSCVTCGHGQADHATGRCVNRRMYYDADRGDVVTVTCPCKHYEEPVPVSKPRVETVTVDVPNVTVAETSVTTEDSAPTTPAVVEPEPEPKKPSGTNRSKRGGK